MPGVTNDVGDEAAQQQMMQQDREEEEHGGIRAQFRRLKVCVYLNGFAAPGNLI